MCHEAPSTHAKSTQGNQRSPHSLLQVNLSIQPHKDKTICGQNIEIQKSRGDSKSYLFVFFNVNNSKGHIYGPMEN